MQKCEHFPRLLQPRTRRSCGQDSPYKYYFHVSVQGKPKAIVEYACEEHKWSDHEEYGTIEEHHWDEKTQLYELFWVAEDVDIKDYETYE